MNLQKKIPDITYIAALKMIDVLFERGEINQATYSNIKKNTSSQLLQVA